MKKCICKTCENPWLDESEFHRNRKSKDGLHYYCKRCSIRMARECQSSPGYKKSLKRRDAQWKVRRKPLHRFKKSARAARDRGIEWKLDFASWSDAVLGARCHYCEGELPPAGSALDRKDANVGYEPGNVVPCCRRCNGARNNYFSYEEFRDHIAPAIREIDSRRVALLTACQ
jgi:hypothetical protein